MPEAVESVLDDEIAASWEACRVLELVNRANVLCQLTADEVQAQHEADFERAAIVAEAGAGRRGVRGLVSLPTTPTRGAERVKGESAALRRALRATEVDKHRGRVARLRRSVGFAARSFQACAARPGYRDDYCVMVTLTYRDGSDWRPDHISRFIDAMRVHLRRAGLACRYVWVAELQARGAIHYHVAVWLPHGYTLPKPDRQGWWAYGVTRIEAARDSVAYLMKYLSKGMTPEGYALPKGSRMHGSGGLEFAMKRARRWLGYPAWLRCRADTLDGWKRPVIGGGWSSPDGVVVPSDHMRAWLGDRWGCLRVADYGLNGWAEVPAGPFSWLSSREAH